MAFLPPHALHYITFPVFVHKKIGFLFGKADCLKRMACARPLLFFVKRYAIFTEREYKTHRRKALLFQKPFPRGNNLNGNAVIVNLRFLAIGDDKAFRAGDKLS